MNRAREQLREARAREGRAIHSPQTPSTSLDAVPTPMPRHLPNPLPLRVVDSQIPPGYDQRFGQKISRPAQVPQWPLSSGSSMIAAPNSSPSPATWSQQQRPQRPPRPSQSRIPSIVDRTKPQQPTPVFTSRANTPMSHQESNGGYKPSGPSDGSARHAASPMGAPPDYPPPIPATDSGTIRKTTVLCPPPSGRRGAPSFYSNASLVSPILEEDPRAKCHLSYASSTAMPSTWGGDSPHLSSPGYNDAFYEESLTEKSRESMSEEYGDESQLVRSASMGKTGKPSLITTKSTAQANQSRNDPSSFPALPDNAGYLSAATSSSETIPAIKEPETSHGKPTDKDSYSSTAVRKAPAAAYSPDPRESIALADPRPQTGFSAMGRPPRLDIDAIHAAEARGSLTSLPDLIRRATRLAAMIDKGKRPASRLDVLEGFQNEKGDRHRTSLTDMLAAFPPPVHTPCNNNASRNNSWLGQGRHHRSKSAGDGKGVRPRRRVCGLPLWVFVLLVFLLVCLIVAAILVPLEFFVFKNLGQQDKEGLNLGQCQKTLTCLNGGTNVMAQEACACICTNGFTGPTCGDGAATGCTLTNLVSADGRSSISNVTVGRAIPRLLADGYRNFSVPLSGTTILARFNTAGLSCMAQNALVTFDGLATGSSQDADKVKVRDIPDKRNSLVSDAEQFSPSSTPALKPSTTVTIGGLDGQNSQVAGVTTTMTISDFGKPATFNSAPTSTSVPPTLPSTLVVDTRSPSPTNVPSAGSFIVTQEKLDFARVAMLYILQEETAAKAISAQAELQQLFRKAAQGDKQRGSKVSQQEASRVDLGNSTTVNLVDLSINVGNGPIGWQTPEPRSTSLSSTSS